MVEALVEVGIDVSTRRPKAIDAADVEWADVVVTMGCGDECPYIPGKAAARTRAVLPGKR